LECYNLALFFAEKGLQMDQDNLKCLYRKAKCLAHLGDHQ